MENIVLADSANRKRVQPSYVEEAMTYSEYRRLIDALLMIGKSTAKKDSDNLLEYSKLNVVRMNRLDRTTEIITDLKKYIDHIDKPQTWLVITEGWCGDAAQTIPVFNKMAEMNSCISLKFLLRDENQELMNQYLTDGKSRSIPKLIALDENLNELFNWGPRPQVLQEMFYHMKANSVDYNTIKEEMHRWYAKDKTITIQTEIQGLLKKLVQ